jgi:hypothetical protein
MKEQRIYKYELELTDHQNIQLPIGAEILTVGNQNELVCLWALIDPVAEKEFRQIEIFGTGMPILSDMGTSREYISTFQMDGGKLVLHAFEYTGI